NCFDTLAGQSPAQPCSLLQPCPLPNQRGTLECPPPIVGKCLDLATHQCTTQGCSPLAPCPLEQLCVFECPPPGPTTTTTLPGQGCQSDADCHDDNLCTADRCIGGVCQ